MLDRLDDYGECLAEPDRWVIATVSAVSGSVPRPLGTSMAVRDDAMTIGSISAGCVESAIVDAALTNLVTGRTTVESFGYADDDGLAIGLMCGGDLQVLVQPARALVPVLRVLAADGRDRPRYAVARPLLGPDVGRPLLLDLDHLSADRLEREIAVGAGGLVTQIRAGGVQHLTVQRRDGVDCPVTQRLLVESARARPRLLIYGANDYSAALAAAAPLLDHHVVVCDARPVFATARRHPGAHEVVVDHPADHLRAELAAGRLDRRSAVVVLTHDPRYDLPVLDLALRSPVGYVGAMGSRPTHERRAQELRNGGLPAQLLDRLHSPIGLNLGARTPAEVAVAILAEIISVQNGLDAGDDVVPLRRTTGPVHAARRRSEPGLDRFSEARSAWT